MEKQEELNIRFTYHRLVDIQVDKTNQLREAGKALAELINLKCPDGREKALAFTKLEEAIMWANAAIARRE